MQPLRAVIRCFDDWLSRVEGVYPLADDPRLLLRIQLGSAPHEIRLPAARMPAGVPALMIHFWNERLPPITRKGADLAWALQFQRRLIYSFQAIALHMRRTASMDGIRVVGGVVPHVHTDTPDGGRLLLERLGFSVLPYYRPAGAFGEFWENFYTWLLTWTYNPGSLRSHALPGLQRNEFWMTRERFLERFCKAEGTREIRA